MAKRKIFIDKDGNVKALCDNVLENIPGIGARDIQRAADVEFNNELQVWEIIRNGKVLGFHPRRDEAIKLEITLMNNMLERELTNA
jgi:hypothetical protein